MARFFRTNLRLSRLRAAPTSFFKGKLMASAPRPTQIKLQTQSRCLELSYSENEKYPLSYEFLRVLSPSAEVRGHGKPVLQTGKKDVIITNLEPTGNYALKITYNDGHDSGLYTWEYLYDLCCNQDKYWKDHLQQLEAASATR